MDDSPNDDTKQANSSKTQSRRSLLLGMSGALTGGLLIGGRPATADETVCPTGSTRDSFQIQRDTEYETEVFVNEAAFVGPTVVVIGGIHGDEPAGALAAHHVNEWEFDCGRLIVIPEANAVALEQGTRNSPAGDLNRQFPPGETPHTPLARELWNVIVDVDPDVVIDLHTSRGIWQSDEEPGGYGQAIFTTQVESAPDAARRTTDYLNEQYVDASYPDSYQFRSTASISGDRPLLVHKVAAELEIPGYITEATRYNTDLETRITWTKAMIASLLAEHGIEAQYELESST